MNTPWEQLEREEAHAEQKIPAEWKDPAAWYALWDWLQAWKTRRWWPVKKGSWHRQVYASLNHLIAITRRD